jgi:hypothetical protein
MKLYLKPPGTERLKLNCDDPLSKFAFDFDLRRYIQPLADETFPDEISYVRAAIIAGGSFRSKQGPVK